MRTGFENHNMEQVQNISCKRSFH